MTVVGTDNGNFLGGGIHGGYWSALAQAQSYSAQAANLSHMGTIGALFAQQAAIARPTVEDAGIRAGEIIAYRAWKLIDGILHSMAADFAWVPGEIASGDPGSGLGVHAFKSLGDAVGQYGWAASNSQPVIFGTVALWGTVIEHEKGYRAEFGAIDSIVMVKPSVAIKPKWKFWRTERDVLRELRSLYLSS